MLIRRAFRIGEAAEVVGVSRSEMYRLIAQGIVKTVKFGNRARITSDELDRLAAEGYDVVQLPVDGAEMHRGSKAASQPS